MKNFRKIWDEEKNSWLINHKMEPRKEQYLLFLKEFNLTSEELTETAFNNQRSRVGAVPYSNKHKSTKARPIYSEQIKKGYVRIKIAQPNVWISKGQFVYCQAHPEYKNTDGDYFIFLDGNNRNFNPENIEMIHKKELCIFQLLGGVVKDNPELTRLNILRARLKIAEFDAREKIGDISYYEKNGVKFRRSKQYVNERARNFTKEQRERINDRNRKRRKEKWAQMSEEEKEAFRAKKRKYSREYMKEKRNDRRNNE